MLEFSQRPYLMKYCSNVETNSGILAGDVLTAVSHSIHERGSF